MRELTLEVYMEIVERVKKELTEERKTRTMKGKEWSRETRLRRIALFNQFFNEVTFPGPGTYSIVKGKAYPVVEEEK